MKAMVRTRSLNKDFKQFQRLPELPGNNLDEQSGINSVEKTRRAAQELSPAIREQERCTDSFTA